MQTPEENAASPTAKPPTPAAEAASSPTSGKSVAGAKAPPGETRAEAGSSAAANQGKPGQTPKTGKTSELPSDPEADAVDLLKADHRRVEALFAEFESAPDRRKAAIIQEACTELTLHTLLEEEIFYPACRAADGQETEDALDEAQVEHDCAKLLIIELLASSQEDPLQAARFKVLAEQIKHHVAEEEAPRTGVFAKAKSAGVDTAALGRRLLERKRRLLKEADRLRPSHLVSFHQLQGENRPTQEYGMPRNQGPERDERGRFVGDDDDDRRGGSYSRSRDDDRRDDNDRGRGRGGWFGDSEGHSMAARSRGEGRSFRDDDDGDGRGWYGDSRGHAQAARRGWDERRSMRGDDDRDRDDRGRFMSDGDRFGRGGGGRGRNASSDRDRDDQGRFMSDDDRSGRGDGRGRSSSSDRDRDERSYRGRDDDDGDGRGWYGDSRGHAEAARRGWENRGRDDDDRSGRSDRGHGGWFGDSRGHSEASRRGWENRR